MTPAEHVVDPGVNRLTAEPCCDWCSGYELGRREAAEEIAAELERFIGTELNAASAAEIARGLAEQERTEEKP